MYVFYRGFFWQDDIFFLMRMKGNGQKKRILGESNVSLYEHYKVHIYFFSVIHINMLFGLYINSIFGLFEGLA